MNQLVSAIQVGETLPEIVIPLTPTSIAAAAIATRDYQPVHHDLDRSRDLGSEHVFLNTHSTAGYLERLVKEWTGPGAFLKSVKFRLGTPSYAGDTLRLQGEVSTVSDDGKLAEIRVIGLNSRGVHVEGTVTVGLGS
ncbi:MAG: MaoC/PaaZ C-terminal domain-containing protein [Novosphingobium sp.]